MDYGSLIADSSDVQRDGRTRQFIPPLNYPMAFAEARQCARLRSASRILALAAGFVGLLVFVGGWALDVSVLRSIIPGAPSMKVNTALSLMISASALLLDGYRHRSLIRLVPVCVTALILLALATLMEYAAGRNFGIDELFFPDRASLPVTPPGRTGAVVAVSFVLLGAAILLRNRSFGLPWSQFLSVGTAVLSFANLVGYLYGIRNFAGIEFYTDMAVHTSSSLLMLSLSTLFARPDRGPMVLVISENLGGVLTRRLLPAAVGVPVLLGWLGWQGELKRLYGPALGLAMFATSNVMVFAYLIWAAGWRLDRIDAEKARATASLQARENLLSIFVKRVPAAVAMLDRDMRYVQVSDRWCTDYGLVYPELLGRSHYDVFPDLPERWKMLHRRCLGGETLRQEEECWERASGESIWLRWEIRPWGDRLPEGILVFSEDITERKRQELELRKFVSLADNSGEFIGMCDMNLMPFYVNQAALQLLGLDSLEQTVRTPVPEFFFPEDQRFITEEFFPQVVREGRAEVEIRFRHFKTGKPIWMIYNVFYIKDAAGEAVGLATVSRDITERKHAEERLRESEERFRATFLQAAVGIAQTSLDGRLLMLNERFCEIVGYSREELRERTFVDITHPDDREASREIVREVLRSESPGSLDKRYIRKDGVTVWARVFVSLVRGENNAPRYLVAVVEDITEKIQAERALQESRRELRALAGRLINAQEEERRRISRQLHDDFSQQLAVLAFDTSGLMMALPPSPNEIQERLRNLHARIAQLSADVRRISHQLHPSILEDLGLAAALREMCEEFSTREGIEATLEQETMPAALPMEVKSCLYWIAHEALHNVAKYAHASHVRVSLRGGPKGVQICIHDDGAGFDPHARRGHGLGLVSMKERAIMVQGELSIRSRPGQGTEVGVFVPLPRSA